MPSGPYRATQSMKNGFFFHFECKHYCVDNRTKLNEKQENKMNVKYVVNEMNVK